MFTWICPKCGGEVPPSYSDCPRCAPPAASATAAESPAATPTAAESPTPAAPAPQAPSPVAQPAPVYAAYPEQKSTALRDIAVVLGVAAVLLGAGYFVWQRMENGDKPKEDATTKMEKPGEALKAHPLAKQIEVTGIRIREPKPGQAEVKMLVVNHSAADIADLRMTVSLIARGTEKEVATFPITVKRLGAFESTEASAKIKVALRAYELPDWQFLEAKLFVQALE